MRPKTSLRAFHRVGVRYALVGSVKPSDTRTSRPEELLVDDISIRVATPRMLWRMKKDTVTPQEKVDAETIRRGFKLED